MHFENDLPGKRVSKRKERKRAPSLETSRSNVQCAMRKDLVLHLFHVGIYFAGIVVLMPI